jgi:NADH-quinone oxidoreductase subunit D
MNTETALTTAQTLLTGWNERFSIPEANRLDVKISPDELLPAIHKLMSVRWGYLTAITGLDGGPAAGTMEALYHFAHASAIVTLRVQLDRTAPCVPSVCEPLPYATLYERELIEMLGIQVAGTPNPAKLFLPDDWPAGVYPLRKDFEPAKLPPPSGDPALSRADTVMRQGDKFIIPIGPQHPALKEPGNFEFTVDGEVITGASIRLGYVHRGIERGCEERNWIQSLYLLERVCGICSHHHAFAYCLGVEKLAGVEAPPRAQAIRELVAGLERFHSHLLWVGVAAHEAGFDTLFMYSWRDREKVMDLLENLTGNRVNYSVNIPGGVKVDLNPELSATIKAGMDYLEERMQHYLKVVTTDAAFLQRTRGVGVMSAEEVEFLGVVGPAARASGVTRDIRVEAPYGSYRQFPVSSVSETAGDLEAKFIVRIKEMMVSTHAIRTIVDNLPEGDLTARMPRKIPAGETISRVEAPRGELFYFIKSEGGEKPSRVKVRTPSILNFASLAGLVIGHQLADVPLILAGIDPCFSCNDR